MESAWCYCWEEEDTLLRGQALLPRQVCHGGVAVTPGTCLEHKLAGLKPFKPQQLEIMTWYENKTSNGATCSQQIIPEWFRKGNLRKESFGFKLGAFTPIVIVLGTIKIGKWKFFLGNRVQDSQLLPKCPGHRAVCTTPPLGYCIDLWRNRSGICFGFLQLDKTWALARGSPLNF